MSVKPKTLKLIGINDIEGIPGLWRMSAVQRRAMAIVASVLPFRTNNYVIEQLIDWDNTPADPMYQLTFPQEGMLRSDDFRLVEKALHDGTSPSRLSELVHEIRMRLNPHPEGQLTDNVPLLWNQRVAGVQHKYPETCLIFPTSGQTCHAYCTYCFRWPQFVGASELRFGTDHARRFEPYIREHKEITDVLLTGGDPMVMNADRLAAYIDPLLTDGFEHVESIRIGTKCLSYWPYRFVSDPDADDLLRLFERVVGSGKHLALMAHYSHWKELSTPVARQALHNVRNTGATIRTQAPIVRHVNDSPDVWSRLWREQVRLGCIPYYMFIARDTGANCYFAVPLHRAHEIFMQAYSQVSGLGRTVRGPVMSAHPGKVMVAGVTEIRTERVFVLTFVQARNPAWCNTPMFAAFDDRAVWLDELRPAFGEREFFYEQETRLSSTPSA